MLKPSKTGPKAPASRAKSRSSSASKPGKRGADRKADAGLAPSKARGASSSAGASSKPKKGLAKHNMDLRQAPHGSGTEAQPVVIVADGSGTMPTKPASSPKPRHARASRMGMESRYLAAVSEHEQRRRQALEREHVRAKRLTEFKPRAALLSATVLSAKRKELNSIGDLVHFTAREAVSERGLDVVPEGDWSPNARHADAAPSLQQHSHGSSDEQGASRPSGFFAGPVRARRGQAAAAAAGPARGCCAGVCGACSDPGQRSAMQQRCTQALCSGWLDPAEPLPARAPLGVLARRADYFAPRWIPASEALDQADMGEWAAATIAALQHSGDSSCAWIAKVQDWLCPPRKPCVNRFQVHVSAPLDQLVRSKLFVVLVTACIFANTVTLAIEHHGMSDSLAAVLNTCNIVFTLVFLGELVLKLMGLGPYRYFLDAFNIFDFVVVMVSLGELASGQEGQGALSAFRLARVFRVARLVRHWDEMRKILQVVAGSLTSFGYLALLLLLFLFVFSLLGMHLLGPAYADLPEADRPRNSFHTLHAAFLTCFQVLSGEGWNEVMEEAVQITGNKAVVVYFIAWVVVGSFVLLNLFLAVLLDGFASDDAEEQARAVEDVEAATQELLHMQRATSALRLALNKSVREKTLFTSERQAMRQSQRHIVSRKKAALFGASVAQRAASKTQRVARKSRIQRSVSFSGLGQLPGAAEPAKPTLSHIRPATAGTFPASTQHCQFAQVLDAWLPKRGQRTWAGKLAQERRASAVGFDDSVLDSCLRSAVSRTLSRHASAGSSAATSPASHHSAATPQRCGSPCLPPPPPPPQTVPPVSPRTPSAAARASTPSGPSRQASQRATELLGAATAAPEPIRLTLALKPAQSLPAPPASSPRRPLVFSISPVPTRARGGVGGSSGGGGGIARAAAKPSALTEQPTSEPLLDTRASSSSSCSSTSTGRAPSSAGERDTLPEPSRPSSAQASEHADVLRPLPCTRAESPAWVTNPHTTGPPCGDAACVAPLRRATMADGQAARMDWALRTRQKQPLPHAKSAEEAHPLKQAQLSKPAAAGVPGQLEADGKRPLAVPGCVSCMWQPRPAGSSGRSCGWFVRGSAAHQAIAKFLNPNTVLLSVPYPTTMLHLLTSCCLRGLGHDARWVIASEQSHRNASLRQAAAQPSGCCGCCRGLKKSTAVAGQPKHLQRHASSAAEHPLQYLSITFDGIILLCIFVSSALLALNEPGLDPGSSRARALLIAEGVFTTVFVLEMTLRVLGAGLMWPHQAYLRSWWNVLDCSVVLISIVGLLSSAQFGAVRTLRLLRSLRPLRLIKRSSGMKVVVEALIKSVPAIVNVMGVLLMIFFVFGIMGTQLFSGTFSYCNDPAFPPGALLAGERTPDGQAWAVLPCDSRVQFFDPESNATVSRAVVRPALNFDHIGASMLTLFVASTGEDWPGAMWSTEDVTGPGRAPRRGASPALAYYWVLFMCFGVFFASELFVGVMLDSFSRLKRSMDGFGLLTARQREWVEAQRLLADARPEAVRAAPGSKWRKWLFKLLRRKPVQLFFVSCVVLNIVFMASSWFGQPLAWSRARESVLLAFAVVFLLEAALKAMAMGFWRYWADPWNRMDFVLSGLGVLDVALLVESSNTGLQSFQRIIRVARSLRILRVVRALRGVRVLLNTLRITLPSLLNVGALLLLLFYVYAVLGMAAFGQVQRAGDIDTHANYSTWPAAMLLLFRMCTGEGWDGIMFSAMEDPSVSSAALVVYHVSFQVAASLVGLNLGVMIVLDGFEAADRSAESSTEAHVRIFKREWARLDPAGTRWISVAALELLLRELPPPLGVPKRCSFVELLRFAQRLDITTWDGYVNFREVLLAVHRAAYGVAIPREILNAIDTAPRRLHRRIRRAIITKQRKSRLTGALRSTAKLQLQKSMSLLGRAKSADAAKLRRKSPSAQQQQQRSTLRTPPPRLSSRAYTAPQESSHHAAFSLSPRGGGMADAVQTMMGTRSGLASAMLGRSPTSGLDVRALDELHTRVIPGRVSVIDGTAEQYLQVQTQRSHKFTSSVRQSNFADELCLGKIRALVVAWRTRARARLAAQRMATGAARWHRLHTPAKAGNL